jgi:hypothetical protein
MGARKKIAPLALLGLAWAAAALAWATPSPASAQSGEGPLSGSFGGSDAASPAESADPPADAPQQRDPALALALEDALGVYIVHPDLREELERVEIHDGVAEVWFLRDLDINPQDARCDAFRWLLLGRFQENTGALPLFDKFPDLQGVHLIFYAVETRVRVDARGDYAQSRTPVRHLELNLSRDRAKALDPKNLRKALRSSRDACVEAGQSSVDHYWYVR